MGRVGRFGFRPRHLVGAALLAVAGASALALILLDHVFPPPLYKADATSIIVKDRHGVWLHALTNKEGRWRFLTAIDDIDPLFLERLVAIEDRRFYDHHGVDVRAIARASLSAVRRGRIVSGASTITMQTARLLEPRPRTLLAKFIEMLRALQIERRLTKNEILELYLTLAPYGGNLEGVRAASLAYFGKAPARLNAAEQALLIALPQAPEARRPDRRAKNAKAARAWVLARLASRGFLSAAVVAESNAASLPPGRRRFPQMAFHAAREAARKKSVGDYGPDIATTLDATLQRHATALLEQAVEGLVDGANASAIVIDNKTMAVRAHVGSAKRMRPGGWMDLTRAQRSPGSTLKPFVYGLAIDDGVLTSATVLNDTPTDFDGYMPENFDRVFRGHVPMREALRHSLNVPAVAALEAVGAARFAGMLRSAGVAVQISDGTPTQEGLALALGGAGVSARDLAVLYGGLARDGRVRRLCWLIEECHETDTDHGFTLLSSASAQRIAAVLRGSPSLSGRPPAHLVRGATPIAFKTGTSYGFRDAWAAGFSRAHTIVVWVGRADGAPRPGATGRRAAAPILMALFDAVERLDPSATDGDQELLALDRKTLADQDPLRGVREKGGAPLHIAFPKPGAELFLSREEPANSRRASFALTARGGVARRDDRGQDNGVRKDRYHWYADGQILAADRSGRTVWSPEGPGFYELTVVDGAGGSASARVKVSRAPDLGVLSR